jgi:hypothetical protein
LHDCGRIRALRGGPAIDRRVPRGRQSGLGCAELTADRREITSCILMRIRLGCSRSRTDRPARR